LFLVWIACPVMMGGCGGCNVKVKCVDLTPTRTESLDAVYYHCDEAFHCKATGVLCTFGVVPPGVHPTNPGEVVVGLSHQYDPGSGEFPCTEEEHVYTWGFVSFDVSQFERIGSAHLVYRFKGSTGSPPGGPPDVLASAAQQLGVRTSRNAWKDPSGTSFSDFDVVADPGIGIPSSNQWSIDVTQAVRDWMENAKDPTLGRVNRGFVLAGDTTELHYNAEWASTYGDFRLRILFNPDLNKKVSPDLPECSK
jgi:hypothetical protein